MASSVFRVPVRLSRLARIMWAVALRRWPCARWRQSGKVGRELDLEDVTRGCNNTGAIAAVMAAPAAATARIALRMVCTSAEWQTVSCHLRRGHARTCTERYRVGLISPSVARSHPDNNVQHFARDHARARNHIPEL